MTEELNCACSVCKGSGFKSSNQLIFDENNNRYLTLEKCISCNGSGIKLCITCNGLGYTTSKKEKITIINDQICKPAIKCEFCKGDGKELFIKCKICEQIYTRDKGNKKVIFNCHQSSV